MSKTQSPTAAELEAEIIADFEEPTKLVPSERDGLYQRFHGDQLDLGDQHHVRETEAITAERESATQIRTVVIPELATKRAAVHARLPALADAYTAGLAACAQADGAVKHAEDEAANKETLATKRERALSTPRAPKTVPDVLIKYALRGVTRSHDRNVKSEGMYGINHLVGGDHWADKLEKIERMFPESRGKIMAALQLVALGQAQPADLVFDSREVFPDRSDVTPAHMVGLGGKSGRSVTSTETGVKAPTPRT